MFRPGQLSRNDADELNKLVALVRSLDRMSVAYPLQLQRTTGRQPLLSLYQLINGSSSSSSSSSSSTNSSTGGGGSSNCNGTVKTINRIWSQCINGVLYQYTQPETYAYNSQGCLTISQGSITTTTTGCCSCGSSSSSSSSSGGPSSSSSSASLITNGCCPGGMPSTLYMTIPGKSPTGIRFTYAGGGSWFPNPSAPFSITGCGTFYPLLQCIGSSFVLSNNPGSQNCNLVSVGSITATCSPFSLTFNSVNITNYSGCMCAGSGLSVVFTG